MVSSHLLLAIAARKLRKGRIVNNKNAQCLCIYAAWQLKALRLAILRALCQVKRMLQSFCTCCADYSPAYVLNK